MRKQSYLPFIFPVVAAFLLLFGVEHQPQRVFAQAGQFGANAMCGPNAITGASNGLPVGNFCSFTPTQLGVNALTLPLSSTSALSSIVDTRGARDLVLHAACTQGPWSLNVQTYAEDGATTLDVDQPVTAIPIASNEDFQLGSEANPGTNAGTISTTIIVRLPQRALAFSFTNSIATAGTCTARLFLEY